MVQKREAYAPWSLTRKAGVQSATVNGDIEVPQFVQPVIDTGFVDERGDWKGRKASDEEFHSFGYDEGTPNTGSIIAPQATGTTWPLDMTGFKDLQIAIRPTSGGNYKIEAIMGPADFAFANLRDVNAGTVLRGAIGDVDSAAPVFPLFVDNAESLTADVWNIFYICGRLAYQKLLQFKITNNSGGDSTIDTAFMRLV